MFKDAVRKKFGKISRNGTLRRIKIQTRLITSFLLLSIVPLFLSGMVSYRQSSSAIDTKITMYSSQIINQVGKSVRMEMDKVQNMAEQVALNKDTVQKNLEALQSEDVVDMLEAKSNLQEFLNFNFAYIKSIESYSILLDQGDIIGESVLSDHEELERVKKLLEESNGKTVWTMVATAGDKNTIAVARSIHSNDTSEKLGMEILTLKKTFLSDTYNGIEIGKQANMYIIDSSGLVLSSLNKNVEAFKEYKDASLIKKMLDAEKDNSRYFQHDIENEKYLVSFSRVENTGWYVLGTIPYSFLNSESNNIRDSILFISLICFVLAVILSFIIARSVSIPSNKLVALMNDAKSGNLTVKIKDENRDEIGQIAANFNQMLEHISRLIKRFKTSVHTVLVNSEKISSAAAQSQMVSEQIALSIQQIAQGASNQAADITESVNHMSNLSEGINKVGNDMGKVTDIVYNMQKLSKDAFEVVKILNDRATQTGNVSENIMRDINGLNNDMKEIKKIVKTIESIAEQTNLLSLNAAIEAARAGESGRGFAVVADEVKKLAEQSKHESITISNIINSIQNKTELTTKAASNANEIIKQQIETVKEADDVFKTVYHSMEAVMESMDNMDASVKEIMHSKEKALEMLENISAVSEESAATSEEVSAGTEEQISAAEELANLAKDLNQIARELNGEIGYFTVE